MPVAKAVPPQRAASAITSSRSDGAGSAANTPYIIWRIPSGLPCCINIHCWAGSGIGTLLAGSGEIKTSAFSRSGCARA
jgi:hypothetical protein